MSKFARDTAAERMGGGCYRTVLPEDWNCPVVPHGGFMAAVALRAMAAELDEPEQSLRTSTTAFAAPVPAGPVDIEVKMLRRGRSMSQATATVCSEGEPVGHTTVAVFGRSRPGFEFTDVTMPEVPAPDDCPSYWDDPPAEAPERRMPFPFWDLVEGRPASGHAPWDDYVPTTSERSSWYRFDDPPRLADGSLDPLALVTLADTMPGAISERMGPGRAWFLPPSADLTVHLLGPARSEWILARNRARHAGDGYASLEMELWDANGSLVAYGTQVMFFAFPDGPPPPDQRQPVV
jgi:acyl-CoA thioesterase